MDEIHAGMQGKALRRRDHPGARAHVEAVYRSAVTQAIRTKDLGSEQPKMELKRHCEGDAVQC